MSKLLSSMAIEGLSLKNRVVMAPMCMYAVEKEDGILTPFHFAHYGARAIGGVGLIIIEATAVSPDGRLTKNDLGLWNDAQMSELKRLVDMLHSLGAKVGIQLGHGGRKAKDVVQPLAPSSIGFSEEYNQPKEMTSDDIEQVINDFKNAADRAKQAGVDMVEIHGAHGYLINQFLEPATNQRTDHYGGNLENRYRLLGDIVSAIQSVFQGNVWVRLSASAYLKDDEQNSLEQYGQIAQWLEKAGVHALDISTGGLCHIRPNIDIKEGYQLPFSQYLKQFVSIPVGVVGLLDNPALCENILVSNQADFIMQGRALLRNPQWVTQAGVDLKVNEFKPYNHSYARAYM